MFNDFFPKIVRQIDRTLTRKQVKTTQKTSLKLLPIKPEIANEQVVYSAL